MTQFLQNTAAAIAAVLIAVATLVPVVNVPAAHAAVLAAPVLA